MLYSSSHSAILDFCGKLPFNPVLRHCGRKKNKDDEKDKMFSQDVGKDYFFIRTEMHKDSVTVNSFPLFIYFSAQ